MKIKRLLIGMLACSAMVACTNDDVLDNPVDNPVNNGKSTSYVSVKLLMADSNRGRAATDGGYNEGEDFEQAINVDKTIFLFYDANGNFVTFGSLVDNYTLDNDEEGTHHDSKDINSIYGDKFIALSASEDAVKNIDKVLTVANYYNIGLLKNKPLTEVLAMVEENANNKADARGENDDFLMTTSVYHDGTDWVETTAIDDDNICATQSEAYQNPVKIYIERAAAKVELVSGNDDKSWVFDVEPTSENEKEDQNTEADIVVDGVLTPAKVKILGWTLNNYNLKTNLVKRYDDSWASEATAPYVGWNNADDHRSYWAMDTQYAYQGSPTITTLEAHQAALTTKSFSDALVPSEDGDDANREDGFDIMYCYEHAKALNEDNVVEDRATPVLYPNVTTVLIAGQVLLDDATDGETLYKYNGIYYREAAYKSMVASFLRKYNKTVGEETAIMEEADWSIELAKKEEGEDFTFGITIATAEGIVLANDADIDEINAEIANMYVSSTNEETGEITIHTEVLTDGYCYYQIPIEHLSSTDEAKLYGVIRNHWYQLKINAVAHVGEPVGDPDKPLPEIPTKETAYYLAAELHVLNWHVVNQDVTLE